ncbi:MAG: hypothetical protein MUP21_05400 [Dehalococcoidia bacterium]|nr:hypothetical protein [Dehalococcoidia bacterium]
MRKAKEDALSLHKVERIYLGLGMLMGYPGPMDRCVSTWVTHSYFGASCSIQLSEEDACLMENLGWHQNIDRSYEILA